MDITQRVGNCVAQAGLGEWPPRLAVAARHAIILEPGPVEEAADAPIGASRLGGMPDLPSEVPWPRRPARNRTVFKDHAARPWPLSFVAQINFAEIYSVGALEGFPSSGRLLFFCNPIEWPWGVSMEDPGLRVRDVLHRPDGPSRSARFSRRTQQPRTRDTWSKYFIFRPRRRPPSYGCCHHRGTPVSG